MKLKLKQGGIVKLQTAWTTMPNINETILRTWDKQSEAERKEAERQIKLAEQQRMYNQLHGLPEDTVFIPTNGGTVSETGPLYNNGLERYLDQTAKGQEMVRMADTAKKGAGIALTAAGGNWLINGLKVAPLLTGLEFVGGGVAGAALKPVGDWMDKTFHTKNQILDFGTALPFVGMIGGAKGAKWLGENKTFRGAIEGFNQRVNSGIQTPVIIDPKVQSTVDHLYREYPDLSLIGDRGQYSEYYKTIFPTSKVQEPLAHGTNDDLILGLEGTVKSGSNSGAPEIQGKNLFFTHVQPYAGLQYSRGLNALPGQNWNRQYWVLKEINGKPYYAPEYAGPQNTSWRTTPMTKLREEIPNKAGEFDRVRLPDGSYTDGHGKLLTEYKAEFEMPEASDKEFLEALGAKEGETFDQFVSRNKEVFKDVYNSGNYKGLYHVKINSENPLIVEGRDTYYDKNGIWDQMTAGRHDAVVQKNAQNEFGTDVVFTEASPERVRILGSLPDRQAFSNNHVLWLSSSKTQPEAATTFHLDGSMPMSRPISEAERLGIPKGERSNSKALEDPYYWGYPQWNSRYNAAVNSRNLQEAQRLRDLHFKIKAPDTKVVNENDMPLEVYHFTSNPSIKKFRPSSEKYTSIIWFTSDPRGKGIYYPYDANESQGKLHTYLNLKTPGVEIHRENSDSWDTNDFYKTFRISPLKKERADVLQKRLSSVDSKIVDAYRKKDIPLYNKLEAEQDYLESNLFRRPYQTLSGKQWQIFDLDLLPQKYLYDAMIESGADGLIHNVGNTKHYLSFDPTQIKFSDPITYDDFGKPISIVKRDNFHNPDIRHKQGGIIKGQNGFLNTWQKAYNSKFGKGLRSFLNGADSDLTDEEYFEKHGFHKPVGNIGILGTMVAPEWDFLDGPVVAENFGLSGETPKIVNEVKSLITSGKKVRSAAEKHESFMKGLNTYTKNKYSLEFKNLKPEYKKSIELEYRDLIGKIHK